MAAASACGWFVVWVGKRMSKMWAAKILIDVDGWVVGLGGVLADDSIRDRANESTQYHHHEDNQYQPLVLKFKGLASIQNTRQGKSAVAGWGRGMRHERDLLLVLNPLMERLCLFALPPCFAKPFTTAGYTAS